MNKIYQKSFPGEKNAGFTLIELLVVVLIIGILAAVALPQYEFAVKKTRMNNYLATFRSIKKSMEMYLLASGGVFPDTLKDLDMDLPGCDFRIIGSASYYDCQGVKFYYWGPNTVHLHMTGLTYITRPCMLIQRRKIKKFIVGPQQIPWIRKSTKLLAVCYPVAPPVKVCTKCLKFFLTKPPA